VKKKNVFVCEVCGYTTPKWLGRCPQCEEWDTFREMEVKKEEKPAKAPTIKRYDELKEEADERIKTDIEEFDRVMGGGLVPGNQVLIGGEPGIGKSTLMLQVADALSKKGNTVLYVSGEESLSQIRMRAKRIGFSGENVFFSSEIEVESIEEAIEKTGPSVAIFDSLQTMKICEIPTLPGTPSQLKEVTHRLTKFCKSRNISSFFLAHVTKEGIIAGPKLVEHIVDAVLYLEGEKNTSLRILRSIKNRFGSTNEIGIFEMEERGLKEVKNPSSFFISESTLESPGSVAFPHIEGNRVFLLEVQALASYTPFGTPRRVSIGIDYNRASILLAVIENKLGIDLRTKDIFINVVGGIFVRDPSADLPVFLSVLSSLKNKKIGPKIVAFGEIGLTGEVRRVTGAEKRLLEAKKLGFELAIVPPLEKTKKYEIELKEVKNVKEAVNLLFG
jgi:DNA repair protein RadA/Sms